MPPIDRAPPSPDPLQPPQGWHSTGQPRLTPPPPTERGLLFRGLSLIAGRLGRSEIPDIFPVFNIHRGLFPAWLWFASRLMPFGRLPGTVRELLILRTAWNCRSRYEWGQHVDLGLKAGLSDRDILASTREPALCTDPQQRLLLQACDDICRHDQLNDTTWQALRRHWDEPLIIEILVLVGHYRMLAGFLNSAGLTLEATIETRLQAFWQRVRPLLSGEATQP